jgi:hypothetical protein
MRRLGTCQKCGQEKMVQDHHINGYANKSDVVAPYCQSCDQRAHAKARREGRCMFTTEETYRLSSQSSKRRSHHHEGLIQQTLVPNIRLYVGYQYNYNNGTFSFFSGFYGHHGYKIKTIQEMES